MATPTERNANQPKKPVPETSPGLEEGHGKEGLERDSDHEAEQPSLTRAKRQTERMAGIESHVRDIQKDLVETNRELDGLARSLGVKREGQTMAQSSAMTEMQQLGEALERQRQSVRALDRRLLEAPDTAVERPETGSIRMNPYMNQDAAVLEKKLRDAKERANAEMVAEREKFVEAFIEDATKDFVNYMNEHMGATKNQEQAEKLMAVKVDATVRELAKRFIKEGGKPDFGITGHIEAAEATGDDSTGWYITGIEIRWYDSAEETKTTKEDREALKTPNDKKLGKRKTIEDDGTKR